MFLVNYDQDLLEEVGTRVWRVEAATITDVKGAYEEPSSQLTA